MTNQAVTGIVTLRMDAASQAFFERMRRQHFPPERNQIAAHLTLFHTLPDTAEIREVLHWFATQQPAFYMSVTGLRSLGRGVAYVLKSPELEALHVELAQAFHDHLSPQDRQKFMPHVVIQNKAQPEQARSLLTQLQSTFKPFKVQAEALDLWHYLNGPWQAAKSFPFHAQ